MPVNPITKFNEPSGLTGEWTTEHFTHFWHSDSPLAVKFAIEKLTANLLHHHPKFPDHPTYICTTAGVTADTVITLRLEAVFPTRRLYSLHLAFKGSRNWVTREDFLDKSRSIYDYWCSKLNVPAEEILWSEASPHLLEEEIRTALAAEAAASAVKEDPAPIAALQQEILAAIRAGYMFLSSNKEGTTRIGFNGHKFVRQDEGEYPQRIVYQTEAEFLSAIRNFHDWEARSPTYPHYPPELAVWQFIQSRLRR